MRIVILGHNYKPEATGIGPYTTELAEHFVSIGHSVTVLTTFPHYPRYRWQAPALLFRHERLAGVDVRRIRVVLPWRPNALARIVFDTSVGVTSVVNSLGVARPNLVIGVVPTLQNGLSTGLLARLWGVPALLLVKDLPLEVGLAVGMLKRGRLLQAGKRLEHLAYKTADHIVVIGEGFRENLIAKGIDPRNISVIPDWVDTERIKPADPEPEVRRHLAGVDPGFLVLHAGTMAEKQGLGTVIKASKDLHGDASIRIALVGDGPSRPKLQASIQELRLENIRILDIQPAEYVPRMLAAADILLLNQRSSVVDAVVPSKLLSYMASGRPLLVAASADSIAAQLVTQAGCAVVVPPDNPVLLASAIRNLCRDPDLRSLLGARGRRYVEAMYGKSAVLGRWDRLVSALAQGNGDTQNGRSVPVA